MEIMLISINTIIFPWQPYPVSCQSHVRGIKSAFADNYLTCSRSSCVSWVQHNDLWWR